MALITYDDKVALNENPSIPDVNKVNASDMNQIKTGVNTNESNIGDLSNLTTPVTTNIVGAINSVVESGTGYVKYADGTMICFYTQDITTSVSNAWGSTLYISNALTLDNFAQTFLTTPCIQINVTGGNSSAFVVNATASSTTNPGKIHLSRPQTDTSKLYKINVYAIGRWK